MNKKEQAQLIAAILQAEKYDHIGFKLFIFETIIFRHEAGTCFSREDLMIILEDYPSMMPENDMFDCLDSLCFFKEKEDAYILRFSKNSS